MALARVHGPAAGLEALDRIKVEKAFRRYYLYYAVRAEFCAELGRDEAAENYRQALSFTELEAERKFLLGHLERCAGFDNE